jgi:hypothetical protein
LLLSLPELNAKPVLKSTDLPFMVDNSRSPYFRPIYEQAASECGQVSAIGYNFTYEMCRLRDVPADDSSNQFPPHFPYNFANGGSGWSGVSYHHSFEVLKTLGCPTVETYGGMAAGGPSRWMSGYDNYLTAMSNRIHQAYKIRVDTEEGLLQLKHWLHNHLDGSDVGGVASFYANAPWNMRYLPTGTHQAGKRVIVDWQGLPTHAMAIVGYNDSICWDYNWDGQYTNHVDINQDGLVDMKDWEIGGLLFADGWDGGINHGDSGKCYMMYKTLAENMYEGGIWNHVVHVVDVKSIEKPKLTAKIGLSHTMRKGLKISCGVSSSINDTVPEHSISFPVFNFQGGHQYMQGGVDIEENKFIEIGLDITPLLGLLSTEKDNKFFLIVEERDAEGEGEGHIQHFSVIDYTGPSPLEYSANIDSLPINDNSTTYMSLLFQSELDIMKIETHALPDAIVGEAYSEILEVNGGSSPLVWQMLHAVSETETNGTVDTSGTYIEPEHWEYGNIPLKLPFEFPFYMENYDSIYIHPAGFIMFEHSFKPWPYLMDPELFINQTKCIAPLLCRYVEYVPAFGHGIWLKQNSDHITISWITWVDYSYYHPHLEFALQLHQDGRIVFIYGDEFAGHRLPWTCGISKGDGLNYFLPSIASRDSIWNGDAVSMDLYPLPEAMTVSDDGIFYGTPISNYEGEIKFCAEDHNHIRTYKNLHFSVSGLGIDEISQTPDVRLYPNPCSGILNLEYSTSVPIHGEPPETGNGSIDIFSANGVKVKSLINQNLHKGAYKHEIDLSELSPGIYFLSIHSGNHRITKKLVYTGE